METLKHLTGLCGEPHLNIYGIFFVYLLTLVYYKYFMYGKLPRNKNA